MNLKSINESLLVSCMKPLLKLARNIENTVENWLLLFDRLQLHALTYCCSEVLSLFLQSQTSKNLVQVLCE